MTSQRNQQTNQRNQQTVIGLDEATAVYRLLALKAHPDRGGETRDMQALNAAWGIIQTFAVWTADAVQPERHVVEPERHVVQPERHVVQPERSGVQPERVRHVVQPERSAVRSVVQPERSAVRSVVQPERSTAQPVQPALSWSKAQVVEWLGTKGWHIEKDRRVRRSFVRFSHERERQDQPRYTYDVVGMGVEMGEIVPDGLVQWVKK